MSEAQILLAPVVSSHCQERPRMAKSCEIPVRTGIGRLDFGAKAIDWGGLYKNPGR